MHKCLPAEFQHLLKSVLEEYIPFMSARYPGHSALHEMTGPLVAHTPPKEASHARLLFSTRLPYKAPANLPKAGFQDGPRKTI